MFYILDFGSSKVPQLISMLNAIGYSSVAHPWDQPNRNARDHAKGIILSGSPTFLTEVDHAPYLRHCAFLKKTKIPVLGICFGHQVIGLVHGAEIYRGPEMRTTNKIKLLQEENELFAGLSNPAEMVEDHTEGITIPEGFIHLASSAGYANEGMKHKDKKMWSVQFHPEVSGAAGQTLLKNFCSQCS